MSQLNTCIVWNERVQCVSFTCRLMAKINASVSGTNLEYLEGLNLVELEGDTCSILLSNTFMLSIMIKKIIEIKNLSKYAWRFLMKINHY